MVSEKLLLTLKNNFFPLWDVGYGICGILFICFYVPLGHHYGIWDIVDEARPNHKKGPGPAVFSFAGCGARLITSCLEFVPTDRTKTFKETQCGLFLVLNEKKSSCTFLFHTILSIIRISSLSWVTYMHVNEPFCCFPFNYSFFSHPKKNIWLN